MSSPICVDSRGVFLRPGDVVRFCDDVAHIYECVGKSDGWVVEQLVTDDVRIPRAEGEAHKRWSRNSTVVRVVNKITGVWAFAPAAWLIADASTVDGPSNAPTTDSLRDLAARVRKSVSSLDPGDPAIGHAWYSVVVTSIVEWARDQYDARTTTIEHPVWADPKLSSKDVRDAIIAQVGMMASARTPAMQAAYNAAMIREYGAPLCSSCQNDPNPRGPSACADCRAIGRPAESSTWTSFMLELSQKFAGAPVPIGCQPTTASVIEAIDIALSEWAKLKAIHTRNVDAFNKLDAENDELKSRIEQIQKALG